MQEFLTETEERLATLDQDILLFERAGPDADVLPRIFRAAHNIKGSCGFLKLVRLGALAHAVEDVLSRCRDNKIQATPQMSDLMLAAFDQMRVLLAAIAATGSEPTGDDAVLIAVLAQAAKGQQFSLPDTYTPRQAEGARLPASLRVHVDVLENLMAFTGELVLARNQLLVKTHDSVSESLPLQRLNTLVSSLQAEVLRARMQPVMQAWRPLPRLLRDVERETGKPLRLEMEGAETTLDRHVLDMIRDPLAHLVRNAAVHGVEAAQIRQAKEKPAEGVIRLSARTAEGYVLLSVSDDGSGLDLDRIANIAVAQGLITPAKCTTLPPDDMARFILQPGFSTLADVTTAAGRGVGLDAVKTAVEKIGGTIKIISNPGKGCCFTLRVPLTLAVVPAIVVQDHQLFYAIPQTAVQELVQCQRQKIEYIDGQAVMHLRGCLVPLRPLADLLPAVTDTAPVMQKKYQQAVILRDADMIFGVLVDAIQNAEDVVVKPLPPGLQNIPAVLGCAILGSGDVAMILDTSRLLQGVTTVPAAALVPEEQVGMGQVDALLFYSMTGTVHAVNIAHVVKVCDLSQNNVLQGRGDEYFLSLDGNLIPFRGADFPVSNAKTGIVFCHRGHTAVLAAQTVLDIRTLPPPEAAPRITLEGDLVEWLDIEGMGVAAEPLVKAVTTVDRILLVDDSAFFCNLLLPVLQSAGYSVVTASSAEAAFDLYDAGHHFNAVISDIEMPGMSGFDLARRVKAQDGRWRDRPLLALSSYSTRHDERRAQEAGFDVLINKFDRDTLLHYLAEALRVRA